MSFSMFFSLIYVYKRSSVRNIHTFRINLTAGWFIDQRLKGLFQLQLLIKKSLWCKCELSPQNNWIVETIPTKHLINRKEDIGDFWSLNAHALRKAPSWKDKVSFLFGWFLAVSLFSHQIMKEKIINLNNFSLNFSLRLNLVWKVL